MLQFTSFCHSMYLDMVSHVCDITHEGKFEAKYSKTCL